MSADVWKELKPSGADLSWKAICEALGTEFREHNSIRGASGIEHSVQAIGVDDATKRLLVVSAEFNPRVAALMRIDIQTTMPGTRVLVARPVPIDIAHVARKLFTTAAGLIDFQKIIEFKNDITTNPDETINEKYAPIIVSVLNSITSTPVPPLSFALQLIQQSSMLNWEKLIKGDSDAGLKFQNAVVDILSLDNLAADIQHGICPIPTYEFNESDWDLFGEGGDAEAAAQRLKELNVHQYFFPPADTLALGMVDRGLASTDEVATATNLAETEGHHVAKSALVPDAHTVPDILEELKSKGYMAEGEFSYELTPSGEVVRKSLKVRPSEGLLSKLISKLNFNIDLSSKDLAMLGRSKGEDKS
ncbi:hypothetical protein [Sinorhizobium meliloti]|uniref:hypothetical protein n=1 Tax=Rhizobium meliloti TaxID=382 RepID=UPI000FD9B20D|nr:hypothetical protein [Sinorhizobium meliloti]RVG86214.1 hypothetical protein CN218_30505 [Sinorhizobium meliloti]